MSEFKSYKFTFRKGMEPSGYGDDWRTAEQQAEDAVKETERIKALKESGEYGQEYELTVNFMSYPEFDGTRAFNLENFGILIPKGELNTHLPKVDIKWNKPKS